MQSLPNIFLENMRSALGADFPAFAKSLDEPAPVSVRLNPAKPSAAFRQMEPVTWHPDGRYLSERPVFTLDPLFHAGAYYVQEASSMFVFEALRQTTNLQSDLRVLDLCAAPGGKSTLLAAALTPGSFLLANEVIKSRIAPLRHNLTKWGHPNVGLSNHDPEDFQPLAGFFDVVLVDAPCSGEGLFRKDAAAAKEWSPESVTMCAARQQRILTTAKDLVKPGGVLLYSTCTFNAQEDEANVEWLLHEGEFEHLRLQLDPAWGIVEKSLGYQFYPHRLRGEGFYLAALRRADGPAATWKTKGGAFRDFQRLGKKQVATFAEWLHQPEHFEFFEKPNGAIWALPKSSVETVEVLGEFLRKRAFGLEVGEMKKRNFVPAHALALSQLVIHQVPAAELEREQALFFLKKENINSDNLPKGWTLARHAGLNLGWMKVLEGRVNNYLPMDWRIRMAL